MNKAVIMSAKYAPEHFSHMLAYYTLFEAIGCQPTMLLDDGYEDFKKDYTGYQYASFHEIRSVQADILLIYNMSTKDVKTIRNLKKHNPGMKVLFVYHEPWFGYAKWRDDLRCGRESWKDSVKTLGRYFFAKSLLKNTDTVLLPSGKAEEYYQKFCAKINGNYAVFPLVFTDEAKESGCCEKKYFSFISTVQNSKNFTMFLDYVRYKSGKDASALFQIATRSDISAFLDKPLRELIGQKRLIVNHAHSLSNEEINRAYAVSNCTWMLYSRSTQSGALCKSFMFGAPVIASDTGSFREVVNADNGILLSGAYSLGEIDQAYESIKRDLPRLSRGARETFLRAFYCGAHVERFRELINALKAGSEKLNEE